MLELYHASQSTCSQKVRICLAEKGLEWQDRRLNLAAREHLSPDYLAINPNGVVPTLVHDGQVVIDSSVICEYLDEVFPDPPLSPRDPAGRAHMRAWLRYLEEVPTAAIRVPSFHQAFAPARFAGLDEAQFRAHEADVRPLRKHFYRRMGPEGFGRDDVAAALEELDNTLKRAEAALAEGPWLMGRDYSIADIVLLPSIDRMADLGLGDDWPAKYPRSLAWYERMQARPAFKAAYYPGCRLSESLAIRRPVTA
jgi:glutathione S-transferase